MFLLLLYSQAVFLEVTMGGMRKMSILQIYYPYHSPNRPFSCFITHLWHIQKSFCWLPTELGLTVHLYFSALGPEGLAFQFYFLLLPLTPATSFWYFLEQTKHFHVCFCLPQTILYFTFLNGSVFLTQGLIFHGPVT
jgi:hypothetical protein